MHNVWYNGSLNISRGTAFPTRHIVCRSKTQISLRIHTSKQNLCRRPSKESLDIWRPVEHNTIILVSLCIWNIKPDFWKNKKKYFSMSSAENFNQHAKRIPPSIESVSGENQRGEEEVPAQNIHCLLISRAGKKLLWAAKILVRL